MHARVVAVETSAANAVLGVVAVLTGAELLAKGIGGVSWEARPPGAPGEVPLGDPRVASPQPALAQGFVRFGADGSVTLLIGTQSSGQGHASSYAPLIAAEPAIAGASVHAVQGDTDTIASGNGTGACRSLTVGGSAVRLAALDVAGRARRVAADLLETALEHLTRGGDAWAIVATDRRVGFAVIAATVFSVGLSALDSTMRFALSNFTF